MGLQNTSNTGNKRFDKNLGKDVNDYHVQENVWSHARNAINNSKTGDLGKLGNEPSNMACAIDPITLQSLIPYQIIGIIHITGDIYAIFSTENTDPTSTGTAGCEIGLFDQDICAYETVVNDPCLNFCQDNLIIGTAKANSACSFDLYWDDGRRNPSRTIEVVVDPMTGNAYDQPTTRLPWKKDINVPGCQYPCDTCPNINELDCELIRLEPKIKIPCIKIANGLSGGVLLNGSYMVAIAYAMGGQKVSDWYISNVQSLFNHNNESGALDVVIENLDERFDDYQAVIISVINQQTVARLAGTYSTSQKRLGFDIIDFNWPAVPIENIPIITPVPDASDAIYSVNNYLLRCGPTSKQDFNYQPLANQIGAMWISAEVPYDYYYNGGNKTQYLRDEVYAFFIRWVYDTGDRSMSYHIPGRPELPGDNHSIADAITGEGAGDWWWINNTATNGFPGAPLTPNPVGQPFYDINNNVEGTIIGAGWMGYWNSTEQYPSDQPNVWNAGLQAGDAVPYPVGVGNYDLCGQYIRHHRFPEQITSPSLHYSSPDAKRMRITGVKFYNIKMPMMNDGVTPVPGVVGYEILRGARNGNKTIIAKGIINNMRTYYPDGYDPKGSPKGKAMYYPNYPYNDLNNDVFLSKRRPYWDIADDMDVMPLDEYSKSLFTFHSPETNFTNPFLSAKELKIYNEVSGGVTGKFEYSEKHPGQKLMTNFAFIISAVAGIGGALYAMQGKKTITYEPPYLPGYSFAGTAGIAPNPGTYGIVAVPLYETVLVGISGYQAYGELGGSFVQALTGMTDGQTTNVAWSSYKTAMDEIGLDPDMMGTKYHQEFESSPWSSLPYWLRIPVSVSMFLGKFNEYTDSLLRLFEAMSPYRNYALRYHSHCFYNTYTNSVSLNRRRNITVQEYMGPQLTNVGIDIKVNNLYRVRTVAIKVSADIQPGPANSNEITRIMVREPKILDITPLDYGPKDPTQFSFGPTPEYLYTATPGYDEVFSRNGNGWQIAGSHYVGLKQRLHNQYSQINGIKQIPISCVQTAPSYNSRLDSYEPAESEPLFGGDTYVGRYTEKNTMFFFYDWLYGQPDGFQFDYTKYLMIPWPMFWANFEKFETSEFVNSIFQAVQTAVSLAADFLSELASFIISFGTDEIETPNATGLFDIQTPSDRSFLDNDEVLSWQLMRLSIGNAWFYLFNSGVRDFYCESEYNLAHRDWGDKEEELYYKPYAGEGDTKELFKTSIIKIGNYYKYDKSLSVGRLFLNYISWGAVQTRQYNPLIAETCYTYYPNRIIYSLPATSDAKNDNWQVFLANNYKDFISQVTAVKSISKSGAAIFFENESPVMFQGVDQLQTTSGTKLTIGDGGLFTQPMQNITNVDRPIEYGSCQNRLSVINTPAGLFWISQNQGKIFLYTGGIAELTTQDMRWWFATYLPYKLTEQFPDFELIDNPVAGIGCQSIYDNENGLVYFCKRDYALRDDLKGTMTYVGGNNFEYATTVQEDPVLVKLGDPTYFRDASWTISYDPKIKSWISWHDWHPHLLMPSKNTFMSILGNGIWLHNERCDSYCNYYGVNYPFEIEYAIPTGQTVNILRSVEYILEVYKYNPDNCYDRYHYLDFNFDEAVIHNSEQVSGLLRLHNDPKNDPWAKLNYPEIHIDRIDILYSKVEQKYRFDQFWDVTQDRGEYNPNATKMIWNTEPNGYVRILNPYNLNYNKNSFERKKFRHYMNYVFLRRVVSGNKKMLVVLTNNKNLISPR